jgi:hypothetical protein
VAVIKKILKNLIAALHLLVELRILLIVLIVVSCNFRESIIGRKLDDLLISLDSIVHLDPFNSDMVMLSITGIDSLLINSEHKSFNNGLWLTEAQFKSNKDSTVVLIYSMKWHIGGFKRETILQVIDSILLVKRFEVLTDDETVGYEFLETFDYMYKDENVKRLFKREYPKSLADTTHFNGLPYQTLKSDNANIYQSELNYARQIMSWN